MSARCSAVNPTPVTAPNARLQRSKMKLSVSPLVGGNCDGNEAVAEDFLSSWLAVDDEDGEENCEGMKVIC